MYKLDYGLRLFENGVSRNTDLYFSDFVIDSIVVIKEGHFTTIAEMLVDGLLYTLFLDFNHAQLNKILEHTSPLSKDMILFELADNASTARLVDLIISIRLDIKAKLGEIKTNPHGNYIPLVLVEIESPQTHGVQ